MTMQTTTTARRTSALSGQAFRHPHLPLLILLGTLSLSAAATDAEERLYKEPMPHQRLGTNGVMAKVRRVSLLGYLEGRPDNATRLSRMRADMHACVDRNQAHGMPVNPPSAWPHFVNGERIDTYSSINRTIQYISGLAYGINQVDCSLLEIERRVASLTSRKGVCDVDLIEKTAHGACDADGHASARAPARVPTPASETIALAERNAAAAALAAAMRRYGAAVTGQRKVIVGLECDVWNNPLDPGGTLCISRGGSFVAAHAADGQTQSGLELEVSSLEGVKLHAVDAKLDSMVTAAIFAPYLAGGFRISAKGARK